MPTDVRSILGQEADSLLNYESRTVPRTSLHLPGPDFVDRVVSLSDRPAPVLRNFQTLMNHGRLGGTGYISILPVDQGVEHSAGASFAPSSRPVPCPTSRSVVMDRRQGRRIPMCARRRRNPYPPTAFPPMASASQRLDETSGRLVAATAAAMRPRASDRFLWRQPTPSGRRGQRRADAFPPGGPAITKA